MKEQKSLLLHACCGPCSLYPVMLYRDEGFNITLSYNNPNIHPLDEYQRRLDVLKEYAKQESITVQEGKLKEDAWEREVGIYGYARNDRCRACYRMRLNEAAEQARQNGDEYLGTTLTVSPYQDVSVIEKELASAAKEHGLTPVFRDFRPWYADATKLSREKDMYRQNYCGCHFSREEAEEQRARRKAERKAEKAKRKAEEAVRKIEEAERETLKAEHEALKTEHQALNADGLEEKKDIRS